MNGKLADLPQTIINLFAAIAAYRRQETKSQVGNLLSAPYRLAKCVFVCSCVRVWPCSAFAMAASANWMIAGAAAAAAAEGDGKTEPAIV